MRPAAVKSTQVDVEWAVETILPVEFNGREVILEARAYQGAEPSCQALALISRDEDVDDLPLVRVHSGCVTGDIFHSLRCDCYPQLKESLTRIIDAPSGILIYLPFHEGRGIGLFNKIRAYALQDKGLDTVDANVVIGHPIDAREYSLAAEILADLGIDDLRLLTNNPAKVEALVERGLKVREQVPLRVSPSHHNERYLETKRTRMDHKI